AAAAATAAVGLGMLGPPWAALDSGMMGGEAAGEEALAPLDEVLGGDGTRTPLYAPPSLL
ncbi:MAG: hypothetical protein KAG66_07360, partial [Methylococcales bacterium]|nr:hypothetical protein [Methylococcales bacterium]